MRIVSLIASSTEIVCALGFEQAMVGRSHECDYPPAVQRLPACSEPKFDIHGNSREIDQRVRAIVRESLSVYRVDTEKLKSLNPDVIITQDHCEVCAVSLKDVEQAVCGWMGRKVKIVTLRPNRLADLWTGIEDVGGALGDPDQARKLIGFCQRRMKAIADKAKGLSRPSVACIEWIEPLMCAGNWVPELVAMAGGQDLLGKPGEHSPWMTFDQLQKADPDVIIAMPCGWDIKRTEQETPVLTQYPGWPELQAVRNNKVYLADGNQYFNRPGPRLVESLEILAEILHPKEFSFGHQGAGWQVF